VIALKFAVLIASPEHYPAARSWHRHLLAIGKREFVFKPPGERQLAAVSGGGQAFSSH
jgi:hypothetical protein